MRSRILVFSVLCLICAASSGCDRRNRRGAKTAGNATTAKSADRPQWLPAYTSAQQAALDAPPGAPVRTPAAPIYPDLSDFTYATRRPFDPQRATTAAQTVDNAVRDSPRLYVVQQRDLGTNHQGQYGPEAPIEPDPWVRAQKNAAGRYGLVWSTPSDASKPIIDRGNAALAAGQLDAAERSFQTATNANPKVPALWLWLGDVQAARGNDQGAEASARSALAIAPRYPAAHRLLADVLMRRGDIAGARKAIAQALAGYPTSHKIWQSARRIARINTRPSPPNSFFDVGNSGAIVVAAPTPTALVYAKCRAVVRYEEDLRAQVFGAAARSPYRLSQSEEIFCLEAMIGAASGANAPVPTDPAGTPAPTTPAPAPPTPSGPPAPPAGPPAPPAGAAPEAHRDFRPIDRRTAQNAAAPPSSAPPVAPPPPVATAPVSPAAPPPAQTAQTTWATLTADAALGEYVLFEIVGAHRPEWCRVAPDEHYAAVTRYIETHVLAQ